MLDKSSLCRLNHGYVWEMMNDISPQNGFILFPSFLTCDKTDLCFDIICTAGLAALSNCCFFNNYYQLLEKCLFPFPVIAAKPRVWPVICI